MTSRNLPPGVTTSMLPGNRPEDDWDDQFWAAFELPDWRLEFAPEDFADLLHRLITVLHLVHYEGFKAGLQEGAEYDPS